LMRIASRRKSATGELIRLAGQGILMKDEEAEAKSTRISVPQFKELTGVTRKHAMALLIYLDREHTTMRSGGERILL
jgi:hypothetical protein